MAETIQQAEVISVRDLTPHVREIALSPQRRMSYRPGQWISVKVPVDQKPPLNRAYSMAEPEDSSGRLLLVFDRVPGGTGSEYLYSLKPNDSLSFSGPHGKFLLPEQGDRSLLLIGRYTGMVPLHCMIKALISTDPATSLTVISTAPSENDLLYHDELTDLSSSHEGFRYIPLAAAPETETGQAIALMAKHLTGRGNVVPMLCGIKQFVRPLRAFLLEQGFDRRDIKVETYD